MSNSTNNYTKVVKGKLSFKGDVKASKAPKPSSSSSSVLGKRTQDTKISSADSQKEIEIVPGTGRITSSGTTIHGHFTEFMTQLTVGDAIIITHPTTLQEETKIVRMVLSNVSIGISSAFSTDLISTTPFKYIKAPKDEENEEEKEQQVQQKKFKMEEEAFGTYASQGGSKFTYRVKKDGAFGGYKIVSESTNNQLSREELLDKRTKKKSDRFCY